MISSCITYNRTCRNTYQPVFTNKNSIQTMVKHIGNKLLTALIAIAALLSLSAGNVAGEELKHINVATESWDKYTNQDGSGLFTDITRAIYEPLGIEVIVEYVPYKRALNLLERSKADAMYGTYSAELEAKAYLITPTNPIDKEQTLAIFKSAKVPDWQGQASLANRELAWVRGYDYDTNLEVEIDKVSEVADSQQGLSMLQADRFDFFLDHSGALTDTIDRLDFDVSDYRMEPVIEEDLHMAFANNERGLELARIFDQGIVELRRSGELRAIFERNRVNYPF